MAMCDTVIIEWFTSCSGGSSANPMETTSEVAVQTSLQSDPAPGPHMPEPGAAVLFGSALLISASLKRFRRRSS